MHLLHFTDTHAAEELISRADAVALCWIPFREGFPVEC